MLTRGCERSDRNYAVRRRRTETMVRDARANLTRRRGNAENVRIERKEMEGGNGESEANEVTL